MTYDLMTYDLMTYELITYDLIIYDLLLNELWLNDFPGREERDVAAEDVLGAGGGPGHVAGDVDRVRQAVAHPEGSGVQEVRGRPSG